MVITLAIFLFGAVKLNADSDKYKYFGYGIGFDSRRSFTFSNELGPNVIIFGADMSSSVHVNNLILDKGSTQGLNDTTLTAEK